MITDEERREVAQVLRGLSEGDSFAAETLERDVYYDALVLRAIRASVGKGDIFPLLADFIDRPTCRLELTDIETHGNAKVRIYECSKCGRTCEEIYGKYERCPHCGAEVIE